MLKLFYRMVKPYLDRLLRAFYEVETAESVDELRTGPLRRAVR